ncbi:hypothetical protein H257_16674 [Aphanomyces astaci]|uniref:DDE Tnp4 domain-containing protein n=1 Tax=Aphanomyces astaci TaxID=112090 RepID=W4FJG6_APHAT|nr:hypothetical protein H257_16674 [Aphanomyces astaci]ETV66984.1 hypothetical protein H257_16674 [Aphanomyces astaci]|eukprot:XP_009843501.1 hypothetical protein H257_16674 [Aphanomyces astaci]
MDSNAAICAAVVAAVQAVVSHDGRNNPGPKVHKIVVPNSSWETVKTNPGYDQWFRRYLRCRRSVFTTIARKVDAKWTQVHGRLYHNTAILVDDRVACAMHYLTHADGYDATALVFRISKTMVRTYTLQVCQVLCQCYLADAVGMPTSQAAWETIRGGFEDVAGVPNAYGAIDGTLIAIKRFTDYNGWYCRKGFPAFNMQAVVDDKMRFMSYSIHSGSQNDKALFRESQFGKSCHQNVPRGGCFVADGGYKLYSHILTSFALRFGMNADEAHYNLLHSRTRMAVECAFGLWKNTFRIFQVNLLHGSPAEMVLLIKSTLSTKAKEI